MSENAGRYLWDNTLAEEKKRLDAQAAIWDPYTLRYLQAIGVAPGWRCLEIGAGSGTVTRWLAETVTPGGTVVATDIDPRFLAAIGHPAIEIRKHDITADDLERDAYDLVFARMVLMHLSDADAHLKKMVDALKPGGWLLVQDVDLSFNQTPASGAFTWPTSLQRFSVKTARALNKLLAMGGASPAYARDHPRRLIGLGLENVGAESVLRLGWGDPDGPYKAAFERVMPYLVQYGGLSEKQVQRRLDHMSDPGVAFPTAPMVSAWGRRPLA